MFEVRSDYQTEGILYESWFVWRWLTRFPEDAGFREAEYRQHRDAVTPIDDGLMMWTRPGGVA